jgi:hypothetical protein
MTSWKQLQITSSTKADSTGAITGVLHEEFAGCYSTDDTLADGCSAPVKRLANACCGFRCRIAKTIWPTPTSRMSPTRAHPDFWAWPEALRQLERNSCASCQEFDGPTSISPVPRGRHAEPRTPGKELLASA